MASTPVRRPDGAKAGTAGLKWRVSRGHDTEAIVQREAGEEAIEMGQAEAEPCRAYSSVA